MKSDVEQLAQSIIDGTATEEQQGTAVKVMQTSMSANLLIGMKSLANNIARFNDLYERLFQRFSETLESQIDILPPETLYKYLSDLQSKQLLILDLYRKTVQGKDLFSSEILSDDEKKVIKLLKSFNTPEEKAKFLELVELTLHSDE